MVSHIDDTSEQTGRFGHKRTIKTRHPGDAPQELWTESISLIFCVSSMTQALLRMMFPFAKVLVEL
jgi:hypothetical protein